MGFDGELSAVMPPLENVVVTLSFNTWTPKANQLVAGV